MSRNGNNHGEEVIRRACRDAGIGDQLLIVARALASGRSGEVDALLQLRPGSAEWAATIERLATDSGLTA